MTGQGKAETYSQARVGRLEEALVAEVLLRPERRVPRRQIAVKLCLSLAACDQTWNTCTPKCHDIPVRWLHMRMSGHICMCCAHATATISGPDLTLAVTLTLRLTTSKASTRYTNLYPLRLGTDSKDQLPAARRAASQRGEYTPSASAHAAAACCSRASSSGDGDSPVRGSGRASRAAAGGSRKSSATFWMLSADCVTDEKFLLQNYFIVCSLT